jgi:NAD(P)-dependent dehydrogenase (short-subunit alcohol dehydrogenase family)
MWMLGIGDKSFKKMSDQDFDIITAVHLKGAFACSKACWPIFRGQKVSPTSLRVKRIKY